MSETPAAPKQNAIQIIEANIADFVKQKEHAIANVHALDGAIQATKSLLVKLRGEEAKAQAAVVAEAKSDVPKIEDRIEQDEHDAVAAVESNVVSIDKKL